MKGFIETFSEYDLNSGGSRGGSGSTLERPLTLSRFWFPMKMKQFIFKETKIICKLLQFHGIFKKNEIKSVKRTPPLYTREPPF